MIVNGVKSVVSSLTNGLISMFGNMLAKGEIDKANSTFSAIESLIHAATVCLFTITGLLIVPFISVYTKGVTDMDYINYPFAILLAAANAAYCLRLPYNIIIMAAGHYKQTQTSAIIEATLNIVISVVLVFSFGLIGVAIGTFVAMAFRSVYFAWYLSKNILNRKIGIFIKHCMIDLLCVGIAVIATVFIDKSVTNYFEWFIKALLCGSICLGVNVIINVIFYRRELIDTISILKTRRKK